MSGHRSPVTGQRSAVSGQRYKQFRPSSNNLRALALLSVLLGSQSGLAQSGECTLRAGECTDNRAQSYDPPVQLVSSLCNMVATVWKAELLISDQQQSETGPWAKPAPSWPVVCDYNHPNDIIWSLQCGELYVDTDGDGITETWFGPAGGNAVVVCARGG